jgi:hypothetical protein
MTATTTQAAAGSNGIPAFRGAEYFAERVTRSAARTDIIRLVQGVTGALTIPGFFSAKECSAVLDGLKNCELGSYDEAYVTPRIAKLGPGAYDFYKDGQFADEYWEHARQSVASRRTLLNGDDPLDVALGRLRQIWDGPVEIARVNGKTMFAGLVREISHGARVHTDEVARQFPGVLDDDPIAQLAFNCYLQLPVTGGELIIYQRRWQPYHEAHRDGYGYQPSLVADASILTVRPGLGDAVLFDPRNYHKVTASSEDSRRIALSFFIGVTAWGSLLIWS